MTESNTKKVLTWLQTAVGRVRDFAHAQPQVRRPAERPCIGVALGGGFARGIAHRAACCVMVRPTGTSRHLP